MEKQESDSAFAAAARSVIPYAVGARRRPPPSRQPTSWLQFANLLLIAACAGLLLHLLGDRLQSPFLDVLAKTIPSVFGVTLAVYLDRWRGWLLAVSGSPVTTAVTVVTGALLAMASFLPVHVDAAIHPSAQLALDGRMQVPRDAGGQDTTREVVRLAFRGFQPMVLGVSEANGAMEVTDSLVLRPGDVWSAFWKRKRLTIAAGHQVAIVSDGRPGRIVVTGVFPDLYLTRLAASHPVRRGRNGSASVYFRILGGFHGDDGFRLPAGSYRVRIQRPGCREVEAKLIVLRFAENSLDYRDVECVYP